MYSYLIIIIPTPKIIKLVDYYRKKYAQYTNYNIIPHITIYPPFYLNKNHTETKIINLLGSGVQPIKKGRIICNSINYFERKNNNVIYLKPILESKSFLKSLAIKTSNSLINGTQSAYEDYTFNPHNYEPHLTIAEKIPTSKLPMIKKELKNFKEKISFPVSSIFIYKQKEGEKDWKVLKKIKNNPGF